MSPVSLSNDRGRARFLCNLGADFLRQGKPREAIPLLEEAHALLPDDVPTVINLAGAYILIKKYRKAIVLLEKALEQEPENAMLWLNLGAAHLGNPVLATDEQQQRAIAAFKRAVEINPATPSAYYNLGLIYRDRGEIELAIEHFRRAVQVNPHDTDARRLLARLEAQHDPPAEETP